MPAEPKYQWQDPNVQREMLYLGPAMAAGQEVSLYAYGPPDSRWLYILFEPGTGRGNRHVNVRPPRAGDVGVRQRIGSGASDDRPRPNLDDFLRAAEVAVARARARGYRV